MTRQEISREHEAVDIRRAEDRFHSHIGWLNSRHSFSFSNHYDQENTHHGLLLVSNDDIVAPQSGFRTHPHRDMEIVTWVLDGELEHKDSEGNRGLLFPGLAQRMSAGTGIWHSEMNPLGDKPVHFIQMWVPPDTERINPGYEQLDINGELNKGGLIPIASGRGHHAAISIRQKGAVLWGGRLKPAESVQVPDAPYVHVFIAKGAAELEGAGALQTGDAVRLTAAGARRLTADRAGGAEVLIWESDADGSF
ncbi:MAG: pirin family protein [Nitrospira sp.]|jgi:redox-sensitive bicupin YhaK (pirin superfamily)|nr:pirin family protein [Nitrospira sp.]